MGNCLDIPPPPPKRHSIYSTKPRYFVARRSSVSGSLIYMPRISSVYDHYPAFRGPQPFVAFEPVSFPPYAYQMDVPSMTGTHYTGPVFVAKNGNEGYRIPGERNYKYKKGHGHRTQRTQNEGMHGRNTDTENMAAYKSSVGSHDSIIKEDHEIIAPNITTQTENTDVSFISNANTNTKMTAMTTIPSPTKEVVSSTEEVENVIEKLFVQPGINSMPVLRCDIAYTSCIENQQLLLDPVKEEVPTDVTEENFNNFQSVDENETVEENLRIQPVDENETVEDNLNIQSVDMNQVMETNPNIQHAGVTKAVETNLNIQPADVTKVVETNPNIQPADVTKVVEENFIILTEKDLPSEEKETDKFCESSRMTKSVAQVLNDDLSGRQNKGSEIAPEVLSSDFQRNSDSTRSFSYTPHDVVLCYDPADGDDMWKIKYELQSAGFNITVSYPIDQTEDDFTRLLMFPQAVVDAKVMIVLLSSQSVKNKQLRDEVSLACITETFIYPVIIGRNLDLLSVMDTGLKLQLACYKWTELSDGDCLDSAIDYIVKNVKDDLEAIRCPDTNVEGFADVSSWTWRRRKVIKQLQEQKIIKAKGYITAAQYWQKCYPKGVNSVPWKRFSKDLCKKYHSQMKTCIPKSCIPHLMKNLKREVKANTDDLVHKAQFVEFCSDLGTDQGVWDRIQCVARETQATRDVLDANSTVRMVAIENIGKFGNQNVICALRELLEDEDRNIRALVTMFLSRTLPAEDHETLAALIKKLDDTEELVREAGCAAMRHLRVRAALEKLNSIRQNDVIPEVRDAAAVAFNEISANDLNLTSQEDTAESDDGEAYSDIRL